MLLKLSPSAQLQTQTQQQPEQSSSYIIKHDSFSVSNKAGFWHLKVFFPFQRPFLKHWCEKKKKKQWSSLLES